MGPTISFWNSLSSLITITSLSIGLAVGSYIYKNIMTAHKKTIYNTTHVTYKDCTLPRGFRPEDDL